MRSGRTARLVQLPVPTPAAFAATGNAALPAGCLASAAKINGITGSFNVEILQPPITDALGDSAMADLVARGEPDVIGLSLYLWNVERSLFLARRIKELSPRTVVIVGGPEVQPDNAYLLAQDGFDIAANGEGEEVFCEILSRIARGLSVEGMPGTAVRTSAGVGKFTKRPEASFPLSRYPSPYLTGVLPVEPDRSVYIETARGCRWRCSFCFYSGGSAGVRLLEVPAVEEMVSRLAGMGARDVYLLDPSLSQRPDFGEILETLARVNSGRKLSFFAEIKAEDLSDLEIGLLARAGFESVEIGLQSVNRETLKRSGRIGDPEKVAEVAAKLKAAGVRPQVDLIAGLPGDTKADFLAGVEFLVESNLADNVQVLPLYVLPGTALRRTAGLEGIVFDPSPPYRVIRTGEMDEEDMMDALFSAEEMLGRRVDEYPRPHLVSDDGAGSPADVIHVDVDKGAAEAVRAAGAQGARHVAMWINGNDLFVGRETIRRALETRMSVDPHCILDVVLVCREQFPVDLVEYVEDVLAGGPPNYLTRQAGIQGENLGRRVCVVFPSGATPETDYVEALKEEVPVFMEMSLGEALKNAQRLGGDMPAARLMDSEAGRDEADLKRLATNAEAESVAFASRNVEAWWQKQVLDYREVP